ncbi:hypothetical protein [Neobacillus sp. YIM B06451]|uniref:hypothetical protein n=1 Tax=Neobacillus sp. YIM B06451 TaxID=3070994 RepID=UPI00292D4FD2|nr:hypothetical protein [Neobacillus sp. YIM B06451]
MAGKNKGHRFLFLFLSISLIVGIVYYFRPLNAYQVFPELDNVKRVQFVVRFQERLAQEPIYSELEVKDTEAFIHILEKARYQRAFGATNIQSQTNAYDILLVIPEGNYSIVLNDKGYVLVDERNSKKKYKILSSKKEGLINLIDELLQEK